MKKIVRDAMKKLAAAESAFVGSEFLAPVVRGRGGISTGARLSLPGTLRDFAVHPLEKMD